MAITSAVVGQCVAVAQLDGAFGGIEANGPHAQTGVETESAQAAVAPQRDAVRLPLAGEHLLRQRRPVVGEVVLGPDERDGTVEALRAEGLDGAKTGQRRADHHHAAFHRRTLPHGGGDGGTGRRG